jgi:hypothetical protein
MDVECLLRMVLERCFATKLELMIKEFHDLRTHLNRITDLGGNLDRIDTTISSDILQNSVVFYSNFQHTHLLRKQVERIPIQFPKDSQTIEDG